MAVSGSMPRPPMLYWWFLGTCVVISTWDSLVGLSPLSTAVAHSTHPLLPAPLPLSLLPHSLLLPVITSQIKNLHLSPYHRRSSQGLRPRDSWKWGEEKMRCQGRLHTLRERREADWSQKGLYKGSPPASQVAPWLTLPKDHLPLHPEELTTIGWNLNSQGMLQESLFVIKAARSH